MTQSVWTKRLTVDKKIVRLLSASTYENFPDAIKEMVSNAYDADANEVFISINLEEGWISIKDNGIGMTPSEFDFYLRIAGQKRERVQISNELKRKKIGQFGIGFLSVFPFGEIIEVSSTAIRSEIMFKATIPAKKYIDDIGSIDIEKIPVTGIEYHDSKYLNDHGTEIKISGLSDMVLRYFVSINESLKKKNSVKSWDSFERLRWTLQEDLPIDFDENSPYAPEISDIGSTGIRVWLNGEELHRNSICTNILECEYWENETVRIKYIIATNWKVVVPEEGQNFKIHLHNVGIGKRTSFDLGLLGRKYSRLAWLSGEIFILEGFDNLLTIDRSRFTESSEFEVFSAFLRSRLSHFAFHVEEIAHAERDITRQLTDSRVAEVGSKIKIINEKLGLLESRGFTIVRNQQSIDSSNEEPFTIDVQNKTIQLIENHPDFMDKIVVNGKPHSLVYGYWSPLISPPVRRTQNGEIEINQNYQLFSSRRYGEVFKRIIILTMLLTEESTNSNQFFDKFVQQLPDEFIDLQ